MVAGDVINTASRLQSAAPPGGILVGEGTYRATRGLVEYREIEPLVLKGKQAPVRAWVALRAKAGPGERAVSGVPMLGRAGELAALQRIFDGVVADRRPHLVTVFGEAGMGKTRLAAEFADQLSEDSTRILRGRALPYGASTPYGPFAQHVKVFAGIFASDGLAVARAKLRAALDDLSAPTSVGETVRHLELLTGLDTTGEVGDRQVLFLAARRFAEALAYEKPTVLIFEDLHWADSGTLDVVELLASRVRDVPLMLVALARPDLLLTRPSWGGGLPAYTSLSLEPLAPEHATELGRQLLARHAAGQHSPSVVEAAEGNPLFIEELAATAYERPLSSGQDLPSTIRELVSARLDALPATEREVLLDAAIIGRTFWWGALARMHDADLSLTEALDSLEARDLIRHEPVSWIEGEAQFAFKHALIRDVAYATVPKSRRAEQHAIVGGFLEEATAGAGATATALARHWREAGDNERALEHLVRAAETAGRGWAKDEAGALYGEAAELCQDEDRRRALVRQQALSLVAAQHVRDVWSRRAAAPAIDAQ
jgi:predicted ATPase